MINQNLKLYFQKIKNVYHLCMAFLATFFYQFPAKKIQVIGITGTDGKTTTTNLIYHIFRSAGKKVSMISTVFAEVGGKKYLTGLHTTTPNPWTTQKLIRQAVDAGDEFIILEITSHALDQHRAFGINPNVSLITNVTHEHLDYHVTFDNYLSAKVKLLLNSKFALVNKDDESFPKICQFLKKAKKPYSTFSFKQQADYFLSANQLDPGMADFNKSNFMAAYSVSSYMGIPDEIIFKAFRSFILPLGRLETVFNKEFRVIIDFAHTPNALMNVLSAIRKQYLRKSGQLIHIFGSAGKRDFSKRPLMGRVSSQFADKIILTEEDYRSENINKICQEIAQGIKNKKYLMIPNRYQAIEEAIKSAKKGDIIVLTGKGHEQSLCRGKVEYPWSEHKAVNEILKKYDYL